MTLSDARSGAVIYFTLDGTKPTASSTKYTAPITVGWQSTINAIAILSEYGSSAVASGAYEIKRPLTPPTFSSPPGTYSAPFTFTLTPDPHICRSGGCGIYHRIIGGSPLNFTEYTGPVTITTPGSVTFRELPAPRLVRVELLFPSFVSWRSVSKCIGFAAAIHKAAPYSPMIWASRSLLAASPIVKSCQR